MFDMFTDLTVFHLPSQTSTSHNQLLNLWKEFGKMLVKNDPAWWYLENPITVVRLHHKVVTKPNVHGRWRNNVTTSPSYVKTRPMRKDDLDSGYLIKRKK